MVSVYKPLTLVSYGAVVQTPGICGIYVTAKATVKGFTIQPLEDSNEHHQAFFFLHPQKAEKLMVT